MFAEGDIALEARLESAYGCAQTATTNRNGDCNL